MKLLFCFVCNFSLLFLDLIYQLLNQYEFLDQHRKKMNLKKRYQAKRKRDLLRRYKIFKKLRNIIQIKSITDHQILMKFMTKKLLYTQNGSSFFKEFF